MVTITMKLEVPEWLAAERFAGLLREKCDNENWRLLAFKYEGGEACPECGKPMEYDSVLQTHVCHHEE